MWLGNEPSNWGDKLSARTYSRILKTRAPVTGPTRAYYPAKGPRTPCQERSSSNIFKYLPFQLQSSKSEEVHRIVLIALQTDILYSFLSTTSSQQPKYPTHRQI
ncbi:unnamed protein product [Prunus armeniaca]